MRIHLKTAGVFLVLLLAANLVSAQTNDSIVSVEADAAGLSLIAPSDLPGGGTFWVVSGSNGVTAPFPCAPPGIDGDNAYLLPNGAFLIDSTGGESGVGVPQLTAQMNSVSNLIVQAQAQTTSRTMGMRTMDLSGPPSPGGGGDGGTNYYTPNVTYALDYGSNLYIATIVISNNFANLLLSNTTPDILYELQGRTNLVAGDWFSDGFVNGSERTNWTTANVPASQPGNFFLRIRSWIDSTGIGIADWWQLQYFGYVGIDPAGDPAGDGYSNLYKFQNGLNPNTFYPPQAPSFTITPTGSGSGVITWVPAVGSVTGYTIYENGTAIATVPASQSSYTFSASLNLNDPNDGDYPTYTVAANYSGGSYAGAAQTTLNPRWAVSPAIFRGAQGQTFLIVPNIPSGVTSIRLYIKPASVDYPDDFFNLETYEQAQSNFNPNSATNVDVAVSGFTTNGICAISTSVLPNFGDYCLYQMFCRAIGANGTAGPESVVNQTGDYFLAESEPRAQIPFVDGTEQLKENLAFQLEAADQNTAFSFYVYGANAVISFPQNYAYAGFYFPFDEGVAQFNFAFLDPFKPFEDNYFYRNFVYASTNVNGDGSLASGTYYDGSVQIPNTTLFSFPEYDYVTTGNTNDLQPQLSTTANQWIYTAYQPDSFGQGNIGITESGTNLYLNSGQANIFGLQYQSAKQLYSDGVSLYTGTLNSGGNIPDQPDYTEYFYGQVTPPELHTVGYYFAIPNQDYLPGHAGFTPTNGMPSMLITAVGQEVLATAWAQEQLVNGNSGEYGYLEQYFDKAYLTDGNGNIDTNHPTGILSEYGEFLATDAGMTYLTTKPDADGQQGQLPVRSITLCADANHDGTLDSSFGSPDFTSIAHPFRFWVNDVKDAGDDGGDGIPSQGVQGDGQLPSANFPPEFGLPFQPVYQMAGTRDLVNFFPVYLNIGSLFQNNALSAGINVTDTNYQFVLSQADNALRFAYTDLTPTNYLNFLRDTNEAQMLGGYVGGTGGALLTTITNTGITLSQSFLNGIATSNQSIILVEAWTNTTQPLVLTIYHGTNAIAQASLYLSISGVEQMFRHKNLLLNSAPAVPDRLTDADVPNEPDTTNVNFIFVHGYNVSPNQARGWDADYYKRLYWSGSHAKFYGVTWEASDSQVFGAVTINLQTNIVNAFNTAPLLNTFLNSLIGTNVVTAHSLGNMLVLATLNDYNNQNINTYCMVDAAVAIEAIDNTAPQNPDMYPTAWAGYDSHLWASKWFNLWPTSDARNTLTWSGRLANLQNANVYNFYSSGEEVLRDYPADPPTGLIGIAEGQFVSAVEGNTGENTWAWQEKLKGLMLGNGLLSSDHGGWQLNTAYETNAIGVWLPMSPAAAAGLPNSELQTNAFFNWNSSSTATSFTADSALESSSGSSYAQANRNSILSDAIPCVTLPIGANVVTNLNVEFGETRNFDMQTTYENGWPVSRGPAKYPVANNTLGEWHHSDNRAVAYTFTYKLFDKMATVGNLK